ncbi:MAG: hypothetical protein KA419_07420 [Acidobacteria bacterium]|nr:hypothetical protein [Acidobacteriota bacterium]
MSRVNVSQLVEMALVEFSDIVIDAFVPGPNELRIFLVEGSYLDAWYSLKLEGRFSLHWERRAIDGRIYRHDNAPHLRWQTVSSFPLHFHDGDEETVTTSDLHPLPENALREFLCFIRKTIETPSRPVSD